MTHYLVIESTAWWDNRGFVPLSRQQIWLMNQKELPIFNNEDFTKLNFPNPDINACRVDISPTQSPPHGPILHLHSIVHIYGMYENEEICHAYILLRM